MALAQILQAIASLAVILALLALAGWAGRRQMARGGLAGGASPSALRLRATLALDPRRRLHLVETDHGVALVLTGGTHDQIFAWPLG